MFHSMWKKIKKKKKKKKDFSISANKQLGKAITSGCGHDLVNYFVFYISYNEQ